MLRICQGVTPGDVVTTDMDAVDEEIHSGH